MESARDSGAWGSGYGEERAEDFGGGAVAIATLQADEQQRDNPESGGDIGSSPEEGVPRKGRGTGVLLRGLKVGRYQGGYTVRELAALSGVAASTITRLELRRGGADPHTISRLAAALEIETAALIFGARSAS